MRIKKSDIGCHHVALKYTLLAEKQATH